MGEGDDVRRLLDWEQYGGNPLDGAKRVLAHPHFPRAARTLAINMLGNIECDACMEGVCKDAGRYVATMGALYLHLTGGLTLPRLKELSTATGYLSPGRARVVLRLLENIGYLSKEPPPESRRALRYVPTPLFLDAWRKQLGAALNAAAIIEPAAAHMTQTIEEPAALSTFVQLQSAGLLQGASQGTPLPFMRLVLHRHSGSQFAWTLLSRGAPDDSFPPLEHAPIGISAMSRRFAVSRIHVRRLMRDAAKERLLEMEPELGVRFAESAHAEIRFLYAAQLSQLLASSAGTIAARQRMTATD